MPRSIALRLISWVWRYGSSADPAVKNPLLLGAFLVVVGAFLSGWVSFLVNIRHAKRLSQNTQDLYGSAGWASEEEIRETGLLDAKQASMSAAGTTRKRNIFTTCVTTARSMSLPSHPREWVKE